MNLGDDSNYELLTSVKRLVLVEVRGKGDSTLATVACYTINQKLQSRLAAAKASS